MPPPPGPQTLIYAGNVLDLNTGLWRRYASITLNGSRIVRVTDSSSKLSLSLAVRAGSMSHLLCFETE